MAITLSTLTALAAIAVVTVDARLTSPLSIALACCALAATLFTIDLSSKLSFDACFIPEMLASALAGPATAFFILIAGEAATWIRRRHRREPYRSQAVATALREGIFR